MAHIYRYFAVYCKEGTDLKKEAPTLTKIFGVSRPADTGMCSLLFHVPLPDSSTAAAIEKLLETVSALPVVNNATVLPEDYSLSRRL
jgi:hypothetical protein